MKEGKPPVSDRQKDHANDLDGSHEFPRHDAGVRDVLANHRDRAHEKANEIGLHKGPLDLPVVDFSGSVDDHALCQNQGACRFYECSQHIKFPIVLPQKDKPKGPREEKANDRDDDGGYRVDQEQGIEALAGGEIKLEFSHDND